MENEIMKFEEVMEFLSVGKNTLYALLNSGEIQAFRIGKVWKIPRKSVTAYVEGKWTIVNKVDRRREKNQKRSSN